MKNIDVIAKTLYNELMSGDNKSEMIVVPFENCDHYKISYRFLANMLSSWKELGLNKFPTEDMAIEIARKSSKYFVWVFKNEEKLDEYKRLYESHKDVWEEITKNSEEQINKNPTIIQYQSNMGNGCRFNIKIK